MKRAILNFVPPIIISLARQLKNSKYGWKGDYKSWQQCESECKGYNQIEIVEKVTNSLLKVRNNEAVFERDGVLFEEIVYSWPLLASLLLVASKNKGELKLIDFGGSLGSSYFQNKKFLNELNSVSWNIVEQSHFVEIGKREFENEQLHFFYKVEDCFKLESPNILLLLSVLQYIENPFALLDSILIHNFDFIIIDRTTFVEKGKSKIVKQIVPPHIYNASYPCRLFNENEFISYFKSKNYILIEEFISGVDSLEKIKLKGFLFKKK